MSAQARSVQGKIWACFIPVLTFTALGVQHSTANMGLLINGLVFDGFVGFDPPLEYGWGTVFAYNLIPASIGNIIGAFVLVVLLFSFALRPVRASTIKNHKTCCWAGPIRMRCAICEGAEREAKKGQAEAHAEGEMTALLEPS